MTPVRLSPETTLTWAEMVTAQPALADLAGQAARGGDAHGWLRIRSELSRLVGWHATTREATLTSSLAYEAAYAVLLRLYEDAGGAV